MITLIIIGFVALVLLALYVTFALVFAMWSSALGFMPIKYPALLVIPIICIWAIVFYMNPFTVTI